MRPFLLLAIFLIILPANASVITLTFNLDEGKSPITGNLDWYAVSPNGQINIDTYCGFESKKVTVATSSPLSVDCTLNSLDIPGSSKPLEIFAEVRSASGLLRTKDTYKPDVKLITKSSEGCSGGNLNDCLSSGKCVFKGNGLLGGECKSCSEMGFTKCEDYSGDYIDQCEKSPCVVGGCMLSGDQCVDKQHKSMDNSALPEGCGAKRCGLPFKEDCRTDQKCTSSLTGIEQSCAFDPTCISRQCGEQQCSGKACRSDERCVPLTAYDDRGFCLFDTSCCSGTYGDENCGGEKCSSSQICLSDSSGSKCACASSGSCGEKNCNGVACLSDQRCVVETETSKLVCAFDSTCCAGRESGCGAAGQKCGDDEKCLPDIAEEKCSCKSSCIPEFDPLKWSVESVQEANNCYNYACDTLTKDRAQPGLGGEHEFRSTQCSDLIDAAQSDGLLYLGLEDGDCTGCSHKVALRADTTGDYHWYRQDSNGYWSHKLGAWVPMEVDYSGRRITNPKEIVGYWAYKDGVWTSREDSSGNRIMDYENTFGDEYDLEPNFCGYFCVDKSKIKIS